MRLIAHAAAQCDLTQGGARRQHERLGDVDASTPDPGSGRRAESAFEGATKVAGADVQQGGKILDAYLTAQVGVDVGRNAPRLPWRKSPAQNVSRRSTRDARRRT